MAPRKRAKPNPANVSSANLPASSTNPATSTSPMPAPPAPDMPSSASRSSSAREDEDKDGKSSSQSDGQKQVRKSQSWYGSWPRISKSAASTPQIARETILGGTLRPPSSSDLKRFDSRKTSDSQSTAESTEAAPVLSKIPENNTTLPAASEGDVTAASSAETRKDAETSSAKSFVPDRPATSGDELPSSHQQPATSSGWLSWLGRSQAPGATQPISSTENAPKEPRSSQEPVHDATSQAEQPEITTASTPEPPATPPSEARPPTTASWFSFWGTTPKPNAEASQNEEVPKTPVASATSTKDPEDTPMDDAPPAAPAKSPPPSAGSTWAFWSRDVRPKSNAKPSSKPPSEPGELAVIGQGSEAHPEPSGGMEVAPDSASREAETKTARPANTASAKKSKRLHSQSINTEESPAPSRTTTPQPVASSKSSIAESVLDDGRGKSAASKQSSAVDDPAKALPPNLLLPSFDSTYKLKENPSILKQITQLLLRTQQPPANHVFRDKETPKIRKAIAIGVHGLFPASYLRPMIGQPTGTSLRFANQCADGIRRWTEAHGSSDCEIEKVALEGEGKIMDRVDNLWKLLLNWIEPLRQADLIVIACHSQGVPVAVMLLAKLVDLGIISNTKIGICAMAGVCLGPFPDYNWKSSMGMLMGTAAELWEFSNPDSSISQRYEAALKEVLEHGARITYIGSIDDQLVPMESAVYSPASHPYIYRAVFIDGRIHAPDFIAHLVGFALKLRNLGVSDHGLIRELSTPLAGSLYSGEGHSRIYHDQQVYDLAVAHALETTDIAPLAPNNQCHVHHAHRPATPSSSAAAAGVQAPSPSVTSGGAKAPSSVPAARSPLANPNPYHLPWIMRGLLEEDFVKMELSAETEELLRQFDDWKPTTKALKDVKYRLEAVRSKL